MSVITINTKSDSNSIKTITIRVLIITLLVIALIWAGMIMFVQPDYSLLSTTATTMSRFNTMFWIVAGALIVSVLAFRCLEKGEGIAKILAMVGLGACAVAVLLGLLVTWEIIPFVEITGAFTSGVSVMGKLMLVAMTTTFAATGGALVSIIEENGDSIVPLKYTALGCGICFWLVTTLMIFVDASSSETLYTKGLPLSGVMLSAFVVTCMVALLMSWFNRRDRIDNAIANIGKKPIIDNSEDNISSNSGLDDIIEKTVEQRIAKEKELAARPPLQADDMAPTVSHRGGVRIERRSDGVIADLPQDSANSASVAVTSTQSVTNDSSDSAVVSSQNASTDASNVGTGPILSQNNNAMSQSNIENDNLPPNVAQ